jgi:hypothetical protein
MIDSQLKAAVRTYRIKPSFVKAIVLSPVAIVLLYGFAIAFPPTRSLAFTSLNEGNLIETLTFVFLLLGGILGLLLTWRTKERGDEILVVGFYAMLSIGLLLTAMEEVAWGQNLLWFKTFETPSAFTEINRQNETTLHNIGYLNGRGAFLRLAIGFGGLLCVWASSRQRFRKIGAPTILLPWFSIIVILVVLVLYSDWLEFWGDFFPMQEQIGKALHGLQELVEMMVGISMLLFVWLNARMLSFFKDAKGPSSPSLP